MYRLPPLQTCCLCISLRNGTKIFGILALINCVFVYFSSLYEFMHGMRSCTEERMGCALVFGGLAYRTVYTLFVVGMLMSLYKVAHPRLILWWVFATIFGSLLSTFLVVPLLGTHSAGSELVYIAFSCWDLYGCYVAYSYYMQLIEGAPEELADFKLRHVS
ncbi:uncharacterized protein LOC128987863 [Macrosteles quadrilineatus]|uniref:uncharacterized protein LOC128987863 n=1 Tax=Macrosteles quadrilineatus TaxID=74068 RepID=UPI0023E206E0|nr:uncharacterized protein LOC128987863 [Macrosteles quadrilineatus]